MVSADANPFVEALRGSANSPAPAGPGGPSVNPIPENGGDDLFDYDAGAAEMFRDVDVNMDVPAADRAQARPSNNAPSRPAVGDGLGIDEEIKVTKKKRVHVKLDEDKLLSQAGIPKLRRISKERLRFKGKGHEFSDISRLLSFYQLWLDDLYPKAKFADALQIIEKLGHSRRLQVMRREWIEEGKPKMTGIDDDMDGHFEPRNATTTEGTGTGSGGGQMSGNNAGNHSSREGSARLQTPPFNSIEQDDLYTATPTARRNARDNADAERNPPNDDIPGDEDLDALMAELGHQGPQDQEPARQQETKEPHQAIVSTAISRERERFDEDEMEAMLELEGLN